MQFCKGFSGAGFLALMTLVVCLAASLSQAAQLEIQVKRGALLYDKWYAGGSEPEGSHPLYPAAAAKQGASSWRCKECHGWDYAGASGRYSSGSHYTGFAGVLQVQQWSDAKLQTALSDGQHDFSALLSGSDLQALALFLQKGTLDTVAAIGADGQALGSADAGEPLYQQHCGSCHGADGGELDFKAKKAGVQGVGWLARENPQESLHKIRWGHPGSTMPSMVVDADLTEQQVADLLAYTQQLP